MFALGDIAFRTSRTSLGSATFTLITTYHPPILTPRIGSMPHVKSGARTLRSNCPVLCLFLTVRGLRGIVSPPPSVLAYGLATLLSP